jgi:hypothetical protein
VLVGAAILGGALVSALVVSVAGSWGLAEVFGWKQGARRLVIYGTCAIVMLFGLYMIIPTLGL